MKKTFPDIAIQIEDPAASREVQEKMFSMGARWFTSSTVRNTQFPCLYMSGAGRVTYGSDPEPVLRTFRGITRTLLTAEEFLNA